MTMAFINLSDNAKKALFILFLGIILLFVFVGYLSLAVQGAMKKQGSKADEMLQNVVKADYFTNEKEFMKFARKKNARVFYVQARIAFLIILGCVLAYLLFCLFSGWWGYNPFGRNADRPGFATLFYQFGEWPKEKFFGIKLISGWPKVVSKPHFEVKAIFAYLAVPAFIVGCVWFLLCTQSFIARTIRIRKIMNSIYRKKLAPEEPTPLVSENENNNLSS